MQGWYQLGGAIASITATGLLVWWLQGTQIQPSTSEGSPKLAVTAKTTAKQAKEASNHPQSGNRIAIQNRVVTARWYRWQPQSSDGLHLGISDAAMQQLLGGELRDTQNPQQQPIQWFSQETILPTHLANGSRYLDITELAQKAGWHGRIETDKEKATLHLTTEGATINAIRRGEHEWGIRWVLQFDRATFWQSKLLGRVTSKKDESEDENTEEGDNENKQEDREDTKANEPPKHEWMVTVNAHLKSKELRKTALAKNSLTAIENSDEQTSLRIQTPLHCQPRMHTLPNPPRLVIDLGPDAMPERDIMWAPGIRWRQDWVNMGSHRFGVRWLEIDLKKSNLEVKPIGNPDTLAGIAPLADMARQWQAYAAINAGFFNRNNYLPLGVLRRDGMWLSAPVLQRGAIGWNDKGEVKIAPLSFQETITTDTGKQFPVIFFNSGYVRAGIARYNRQWGKTYTPLTNGEIIVLVKEHRVVKRHQAKKAGEKAYDIPTDGYLLTLRSFRSAARWFSVGTRITSKRSPQPTDFNNYPQILGAGPILLKNGKKVLSPYQESFGSSFAVGQAPRSVIGTTDDGKLLLATIHYSCTNGEKAFAPNLETTAQIMQKLGAVDALNLDGGNSSTLYLGGQILNKSPRQTGRIHNGIGVFLENPQQHSQ